MSAASAAGGDAQEQLFAQLQDVPSEQLMQIRKQVQEEAQYFNESFQQLRMAQSRKTLKSVTSAEGQQVLVPLTSSLYVRGNLENVNTPMVEIGTGYFAKKSTEECDAFFKRKCDMIGEQLGRLERQMMATKNKMDNVDAVLQQRMRK